MAFGEQWHVIDGAPNYLISNEGFVKREGFKQEFVRIRTNMLGFTYVNLIVNGKVKRFYTASLMRQYFGEKE
jgi:hypothetical protein